MAGTVGSACSCSAMISIETHRSLYTQEGVSESLAFAQALPVVDAEPTDFHFYWRVPREFTRKQVLPVKSAIVTQRPGTRIHLWSNVDLSQHPLVAPLLPFIDLKIWDWKREAVGTPVEHLAGLTDDDYCYLGGDLFRLLCLHNYGGVYCDMDVVVLRDFTPLLLCQFMYQWGAAGVVACAPTLWANGAIMRLFAGSDVSRRLLEELAKVPGRANDFCWGADLYKKVSGYSILPGAWFNTEWVLGQDLKPFTNCPESANLYEGAFTWHWHNKWDAVIEDGSKFHRLEQRVDALWKERSCR